MRPSFVVSLNSLDHFVFFWIAASPELRMSNLKFEI